VAAPVALEVAAPVALEVAAPVALEVAAPVALEVAAPVALEVAAPVALEVARDAPLTEPQVEIWVSAQQGSDASCAYNEAFTVSLAGALDEAALRDAVQAIVDRHDALRATFDPDGGAVRFKPRLALEIPLVDLTLDAAPDDALRRVIQENARTPFDLARGPLVRVALIRLAPQRHELLFTSHHIICDGWSTNVILEELGELYSARRRGEAADLPVAASFRAYAAGVHAESDADSSDSSAVEAYWLDQFAERPPALDLPTDRPRPAVKSFRGATLRRTIAPELHRALTHVGARHGCTLFATLLAGFEALLCRLSGQRDVVVGIPAAAQSLLAGQTLVGHCVNFLALRGRFSEDDTFAQFLTETQGTLLGAYEHQQYTYGTLVRKLRLRRDPGRQPLIEAQFNLEKIGANARFDGLEVAFAPCPKEFVTFDLFVNVVETPTGLVVDCDYNADLFDEGTIGRWLGHYQTLLAGVVTDPTQRLGALPLLTGAERHQLLVTWNDTRQTLPTDQCVHDRIAAQAARTPDALAVVGPDGQLTYRELEQRANKLAHYLRRRGVGSETLVGVCLERSTAMVVGLLGILKAGGAYLPLDPAYPPERLAFMLTDARPPVLVTREPLRATLPAYGGAVVCLDRDRAAIARESPTDPIDLAAAPTPENLAYVIYTSGSTGRPKGVLGVHRGVMNRCNWMWGAYPFETGEMCCQKTSLSFVDSVWEIFGPLLRGVGSVIIPDATLKDHAQLIQTLAATRVTRIVLVPSLLRALLDAYPDLQERLPTLTFWVSSGEALSRELAQRFREHMPRARLINLYGSSEVSADVTCYDTRDWTWTPRTSPSAGRSPIHRSTCLIATCSRSPSAYPANYTSAALAWRAAISIGLS